jgi:(p)ppGpp synthase/HD superfamily hydrolase
MRPNRKKVYSERLERAIQKTTLLHREQIRRTPDTLPYISHLFSVFIILSSYTDDEDTLIAGLLHDSIEDTDYTFSELEADFGTKVSEMVKGVTEEKERDGVALEWKERKMDYLKKLKNDSEESMLICVADKIYNLQALVRDYRQYGRDMWNFIEPGLKDKLWYHDEVVSVLEERIRDKRALNDLKKELFRTRAILTNRGFEEEPVQPLLTSRVLTWMDFSALQAIGKKRAKTLRSKVLSARIFGYGNRNTS